MLQQLGAPPDVRALFTAMAQDDIDPMMLMMLMGMAGAGGGGGDGDAIGLAMLMRAMGSQGKQPTAVVNGDKLLVIEDGVVYRVDLTKMAVDGQVTYRPKRSAVAGLAKLLPLMAGAARPECEQAACLSHLKQLGVAIMMYAQDFDEQLPGENWAEEIRPYIADERILRGPAAGEAMPAYGLNEKMLGLVLTAITEPASTVLAFERDPGEAIVVTPAVGGPNSVVARHEGSTNVLFADGHARLLPLDQVLQLKWDP